MWDAAPPGCEHAAALTEKSLQSEQNDRVRLRGPFAVKKHTRTRTEPRIFSGITKACTHLPASLSALNCSLRAGGPLQSRCPEPPWQSQGSMCLNPGSLFATHSIPMTPGTAFSLSSVLGETGLSAGCRRTHCAAGGSHLSRGGLSQLRPRHPLPGTCSVALRLRAVVVRGRVGRGWVWPQ